MTTGKIFLFLQSLSSSVHKFQHFRIFMNKTYYCMNNLTRKHICFAAVVVDLVLEVSPRNQLSANLRQVKKMQNSLRKK